MTTYPNTAPESDLLLEDEEAEVRFAAQRMMAAQIGRLPERLLLNRARSEGQAHQRSSSAELDALE